MVAVALNAAMDDGRSPADVGRECRAAMAALDRNRAVRAFVRSLGEPGGVSWLAEASSESDVMVLGEVFGTSTGLLRGLRVPSGLGLTGKVYSTLRPAWVDDYFVSPAITHTFDRYIEAEGLRRLLAVPVFWDAKVLGVLAFGSREDGAFGDRSVERAQSVAADLALAVQIAERARITREVAVLEERSRLAGELHDSVGALLFAIGSNVAALSESAGGDPLLRERLLGLQQQAAQASAALREAMRTLRSAPAAFELSVQVQADCAAFTDRSGVPAQFFVLDELPPLPPAAADVVLRVVREALLNVEKHASAAAVAVTLSRTASDRGVVLAVSDDGTGFVAEQCRAGLGLAASTAAVARLGGRLRVESESQYGTTVRVELPC